MYKKIIHCVKKALRSKPYWLEYSDGNMKGSQEFGSVEQAKAFIDEKGLTDFAMFQQLSGFHSSTQDEYLVIFGRDDNYWMAHAFRDPALRDKIYGGAGKTKHYHADPEQQYKSIYFDDDFNVVKSSKKTAMAKEDILALGHEAGVQAADAIIEDNPALAQDRDAWVDAAMEAELTERKYSPMEYMGHEMGEEESGESLSDVYEQGVADGIHSIVYGKEKAMVANKK